ncbi:MAG: NAD+ synthase [Zestosphaera sp.]
MLPPHLRLDFRKAEEVIKDFIRGRVREAGASGVVIGLSGGGDSSVCAAISARALGPSSVTVVHMPDSESDPASTLIANKVANGLSLDMRIIDLTEVVTSFLKPLGISYGSPERLVRGNVKARARMVILYAIANRENMLVVGTSDRSEWLIGFFTKWGDGAGDVHPLIGLYKTQVREFAKHLNLPSEVVARPPSPDLWPGHTAEGELGLTYDEIDEVLYRLFDEGLRPEDIPKASGIPQSVVERVLQLHRRTAHKRAPIAAPFHSFKELEGRGPGLQP